MNLKLFLRPTKKKLLLFAILVLVTPFPITYEINCDPFPCPSEMENYTEWSMGVQIFWKIINALDPIGYAKLMIGYYLLNNFFFVFPILIIDYVVACSFAYLIRHPIIKR